MNDTNETAQPVYRCIRRKLEQAFAPSVLQLANESGMHNVPANSETHFKLVMVSDQFAGLAKVRRHQAVYSVLADELVGEVHALALHLFCPREWGDRDDVPASPDCMGGSKK